MDLITIIGLALSPKVGALAIAALLIYLVTRGLCFVDLGTGTTIVFGTSGFTAEVTDIQGSGLSREDVDTSHHGTTQAASGEVGARTFVPTKLTDPGTLRVTVHFDPSNPPPIEEDPETITITFPTPGGLSTPADWEGTGYVKSVDWGAPVDDKMEATLEIKLSGPMTVTPAA